MLSKPHGFSVIQQKFNLHVLRLLNDFFKLREEEREAIETGIEDTKNGLQLEDIQLIQEFNLVSVCLEENSGIDAVSRSFMSSFFSICICKPACLLQ